MAVDRISICPTLIRTFYQKGEHHTIADFVKELPSPELYLYTWRDATLRELSYTIVRSAKLGDVQSMSFAMVAPDLKLGGWTIQPLGIVDMKNTEVPDARTIDSYGFQPGFFFDVACIMVSENSTES
jgi:hypothetical protein